MSLPAYEAVWATQGLKPMEKLVLAAFADFANPDGGSIFPSVQTMLERTGLSERGFQGIVVRLLEAGLLELVEEGGGRKANGKGRTSCYRLPIDPRTGELRSRPKDGTREPRSSCGVGRKNPAAPAEYPAAPADLPRTGCGGSVRDPSVPPERAREERERLNGWPGANLDDARQSIRFLLSDLELSAGSRAGFTQALAECSTLHDVYRVRDQAREAARRAVG